MGVNSVWPLNQRAADNILSAGTESDGKELLKWRIVKFVLDTASLIHITVMVFSHVSMDTSHSSKE